MDTPLPSTPVPETPSDVKPDAPNATGQPEPQKPDQPSAIKIKVPNLNWVQTQSTIGKLEEKISTKVLCYYTGDNSSIHMSHPDFFLELLRKMGHQPKLALIIVSNGGQASASLRVASIVREYCDELTVIVPSRCASAATMIALAADKIVFTPAGYLTAIDASLTHPLNPKGENGSPVSVSVDQIKRSIRFLKEEGDLKVENNQTEGPYRTLFKYIHPAAIAEIDRTSAMSELLAKKLMKMHVQTFPNSEVIDTIANQLVNNYPTHGFPILFSEAKELGLPAEKADTAVSDLLWDLVKLYDRSAMETVTNMTPELYHYENFPVSIEALGQRVTHQYSYNRRFSPVAKIWRSENDNSRWIKIFPPADPTKQFDISYLDFPDKESATPPADKSE